MARGKIYFTLHGEDQTKQTLKGGETMQLRKYAGKTLLIAITISLFIAMAIVGNVHQEREIVAHANKGNLDNAINLNETPIENFTGVHLIPNSNYFYLNPKHHSNLEGESFQGLCSTVAVQLLVGYHNYYSDRRLIPANANGKQFLSTNYGDIDKHPNVNNIVSTNQGCAEKRRAIVFRRL